MRFVAITVSGEAASMRLRHERSDVVTRSAAKAAVYARAKAERDAHMAGARPLPVTARCNCYSACKFGPLSREIGLQN
jgi:hypothetical protein